MNKPTIARGHGASSAGVRGVHPVAYDDGEDENSGFPDIGGLSDEENEDAYGDGTKGVVSPKTNELVKIVYNKTVAAELVQKFALKRFNKAISKKIFKFRTYKFFSFVNIKKLEFLKKLQSVGGEFCMYEEEISTIVKEDCVYIIRNEIRQDLIIAFVNIYGITQESVNEAVNNFSNVFLDNKGAEDIYCELCWLINSDGRTEEKFVREKLDDIIYKEAYPYIDDMDSLIDKYLKGDSPVLILVGTPGTGKTRLIRHILKKIAILKRGEEIKGFEDSACKVMYCSSSKIIEDGKLFIDFITEDYNAIVLEDVDNYLRPRSDGNEAMAGLLSSSNGLIVSTIASKKIILSTNLPNVEKIDEALVRPGRCFSVIQTRKLHRKEAEKFLKVSENEDKQLPEDKDEFALSELYHLIKYSTVNNKSEKVRKVGFN